MRTTNKNVLLWLGMLLSTFPHASYADEFNAADTAWILTATGMVLFMTVPGVALFYGGLVRTKNVLSVLMQCFAITTVVSLLWIVIGYSLALTDGGPLQSYLGGINRLLLHGLEPATLRGNLPEAVFSMYHLTFAIFAPALLVGGIAERMNFKALLWFTGLWSLLVYVPVCHWIWGEGWLAQLGVMDFAGGIVVHATAGTAALVAAFLLGPRQGFPKAPVTPHNLTMTATGAGILWVGWHGFSAGSALMASGSAAMAMLNTHIGATAGAFVWMVIEWTRYGKPTLLGVITGMIAGLGMISPGAGYIGPIGALIIGCIAGATCLFAIDLVKRHLHIDDALDVFPVHGVGGILGAILTGVFAAETLGGNMPNDAGIFRQVSLQLLGVGTAILWSGFISFIILSLLKQLIGLRVSLDEEHEGLDVSLHNGTGYNL